ncbi:MAG: hypothetical protein J6P79_06205 [Pseudobutyrivibrio sp.]|nr:hypothetical protein [Pseudobutyrivibrio sp.]
MATRFPCPKCAGQLRFAPKEQRLKCVSCGQYTNPDSYKPDDSFGIDSLNTKIYICPTCGGEIQLIDNDGMEFCPYCGNQATMQEHFSDEGVPRYIMPFKFDKADAKEKYEEKTKKIPFAPDGLNEDENIEKMVGLYVPYYIYEYGINDEINFDGSASRTEGKYYITDYAKIKVSVDVEAVKVSYDASQFLDDTISSKLEPFPMDELEEFNPNYLAGFFVENSSVDKDLYFTQSYDRAVDYMYAKVMEKAGIYKPVTNIKKDVITQLKNDMQTSKVEGAYLPFYFLTTKYGDRVAYSIVNGVSGKLYMDMPVDKRKMFKTAIKTSAIIFVVLLLASFIFDFSFKIQNVTTFSAFISSLIAFVGAIIAAKTYRRDNHLDDIGFFKSKDNLSKKIKTEKTNKMNSKVVNYIIIILMGLIILSIMSGSLADLVELYMMLLYPISVVLIIISFFKVKKGKKKVLLLGFFGWLFSTIIRISAVPNDIFYYSSMIVVFLIILLSVDAIVNEYNAFATRPTPQFNKKGGGLEHAR